MSTEDNPTATGIEAYICFLNLELDFLRIFYGIRDIQHLYITIPEAEPSTDPDRTGWERNDW